MEQGAVLTTVISASVATIGVIVAKDAKVSEFRQAWIDALREDVSRECAVLQSLNAHMRRVYQREANLLEGVETVYVHQTETSEEEWQSFYANGLEANELSTRISLRLDLRTKHNTPKQTHLDLHNLVSEAHALAAKEDTTFVELSSHLDKVRVKTNEVLEEAWKRVKHGELRYQLVLWSACMSLVLSVGYAAWSQIHQIQQQPQAISVTVEKPVQLEQHVISVQPPPPPTQVPNASKLNTERARP